MKKFAVLAAIASILALSGCLDTRLEREFKDMKARAEVAEVAVADARKAEKEARDELALIRDFDIGTAHAASGPCFRFGVTEAAAKRQATLCEVWIKGFEAKARRQTAQEQERSKAAQDALLDQYPAVMARYLFLVKRQSAARSVEGKAKSGAAINRLLNEHPAFTSALESSEYQQPPSAALAQSMDELRRVHAAIARYVRATGGPRP